MVLKKKKIDSPLVEDEKTPVVEMDPIFNVPINKKVSRDGGDEVPEKKSESPVVLAEVKEKSDNIGVPEEVSMPEEVSGGPLRENSKKYIRVVEITAVVLFIIIVSGFSFIKWRDNSKVVVYVAPNSGAVGASAPAAPEPAKESFVVQEIGSVVGSSKENIATADPKIFKPSTEFKSFNYDASVGKIVSVFGTCRDSYYAILVFEEGRDYRKEPSASRYNSAFPCPSGGKFSAEINLKEANLPSGKYYMFVADQGNTGSWYNPR